MIEMSEELMKNARRVLDGDILDMPLLHKQDVEKILYYCIGFLSENTGAALKATSDIDLKYELLTDGFNTLSSRLDDL